MTREEAVKELTDEFNIFLEGTGLDDEEYLESKMNENEDLRRVVEANRMAIKALEQGDVLDKIRAEIEQEITYKPMEMWDYRMGLTKALEIIDKNRAESEGKE